MNLLEQHFFLCGLPSNLHKIFCIRETTYLTSVEIAWRLGKIKNREGGCAIHLETFVVDLSRHHRPK
jgi:hypothetical protein